MSWSIWGSPSIPFLAHLRGGRKARGASGTGAGSRRTPNELDPAVAWVSSCCLMFMYVHVTPLLSSFWDVLSIFNYSISLDAKSRTGHIFGKQKIGVQPMMDIWGTLQWPLQIWRYATLPCTRFETRRALKPQLSSASQRGTQRIDQNFLESAEPSPSSFRW